MPGGEQNGGKAETWANASLVELHGRLDLQDAKKPFRLTCPPPSFVVNINIDGAGVSSITNPAYAAKNVAHSKN